MSASIGGGSRLKPTTVRATRNKHGAVDHSATTARPMLQDLLICKFTLLRSKRMILSTKFEFVHKALKIQGLVQIPVHRRKQLTIRIGTAKL